MTDDQHAYLSFYRLPLEIEQVEDGSFMATSPAFDGLLVLADTVEEVISLVPGIAKALIGTMLKHGVKPPLAREELTFPVKVEFLVL